MKLLLSRSAEATSCRNAGDHETSAAHRVLGLPELRDTIIAHSSHTDYRRLRAVNHAFAASLNAPLIWRDEYAPADLLWPSRTIYTAIVPDATSEPTADADLTRPRKSRSLGTYQGEPWTLKTGLPPKRQDSDISERYLDKVAFMTAVAHGYRLIAIGPGDEERRRKAEQERAYAFLLDRAYRLRTGQPIATYRKEVPQFIALASVFLGIQFLLGPYLMPFDQQDLHGWARVRNEARLLACISTWLIASMVTGLTTVVWAGDDMTLANMVMGPFQKRKLNAWALQVAAAQQTRDTAISATA